MELKLERKRVEETNNEEKGKQRRSNMQTSKNKRVHVAAPEDNSLGSSLPPVSTLTSF